MSSPTPSLFGLLHLTLAVAWAQQEQYEQWLRTDEDRRREFFSQSSG